HGPSLATDYQIPSTIPGTARIEALPLGALLGVMPWNFPYYQVARFAAPNLVLGNTITLKHADVCGRAALIIAELFRAAGVLDASDVAAVAREAWEFRVYNAGQVCNSNKRLIVMDDIYDDFVAELVRLGTGLKPGDPLNLGEDEYVPLSSRTAAETVDAQVKKAVSAGARVLVGGELSEGPSAYYSPAVLVDVPRDSESYGEEIFGPVATVYRVSSDEEALELANDCALGLGGSVFSTDEARADR